MNRTVGVSRRDYHGTSADTRGGTGNRGIECVLLAIAREDLCAADLAKKDTARSISTTDASTRVAIGSHLNASSRVNGQVGERRRKSHGLCPSINIDDVATRVRITMELC